MTVSLGPFQDPTPEPHGARRLFPLLLPRGAGGPRHPDPPPQEQPQEGREQQRSQPARRRKRRGRRRQHGGAEGMTAAHRQDVYMWLYSSIVHIVQ